MAVAKSLSLPELLVFGLAVSWHPPHGSIVMLVEPKEAYHSSIALSQLQNSGWITDLGQ
jgi:hypothetical protein